MLVKWVLARSPLVIVSNPYSKVAGSIPGPDTYELVQKATIEYISKWDSKSMSPPPLSSQYKCKVGFKI